jgi:hypothetical protein
MMHEVVGAREEGFLRARSEALVGNLGQRRKRFGMGRAQEMSIRVCMAGLGWAQHDQ